jgi:hypothetical protein
MDSADRPPLVELPERVAQEETHTERPKEQSHQNEPEYHDA